MPSPFSSFSGIRPHFSHGLILGKFSPLHMGHCFLIESARKMCENVHVCLCSTKDDEICGSLRYAWLCEQYKTKTKHIILHHITKEIKGANVENPRAPLLWAREIRETITTHCDVVFASEGYGRVLAHHLDARFYSVDKRRKVFPVSGEKIRQKPYLYWKYLPAAVRRTMVMIVGVRGKFSQRLVSTLGGTPYIPYELRIPSDVKNSKELVYAESMALSELEAVIDTSAALVCLMLPYADRRHFVETMLCHYVVDVDTMEQYRSACDRIRNHMDEQRMGRIRADASISDLDFKKER